MGQHRGEISSAVGAVFVRAQIQADDAARRAQRQRMSYGLHPIVIEPKAVDRCLIRRQTEQPGPGVAGLRTGGRGPHLDKPETTVRKGMQGTGILVESGGKPDRIRHLQPSHGGCQPGRGERPATRPQPGIQRPQRQPMRGFRVDPAQPG